MPSRLRPVARRSKTGVPNGLRISAGQALQCTIVVPFARSRALNVARRVADDARIERSMRREASHECAALASLLTASTMCVPRSCAALWMRVACN
jgi:hypothetical protein